MAVDLDFPGRSLKEQTPGQTGNAEDALDGVRASTVSQIGILFARAGKEEAVLLHDVKYLSCSLKN